MNPWLTEGAWECIVGYSSTSSIAYGLEFTSFISAYPSVTYQLSLGLEYILWTFKPKQCSPANTVFTAAMSTWEYPKLFFYHTYRTFQLISDLPSDHKFHWLFFRRHSFWKTAKHGTIRHNTNYYVVAGIAMQMYEGLAVGELHQKLMFNSCNRNNRNLAIGLITCF